MRFHLLSDLHLEESSFTLQKPEDSDFLIFAGDIGDPRSNDYIELLEQASKKYRYVFVVKGNHECYGMTQTQASNHISNICSQYNNVVFLDNTSFDLDNKIRVIGLTLWTNIDDDQRSHIALSMNDFKHIKQWSVELHNFLHYRSVKYIKKEIEKAVIDNKNLIVISHHAPLTLNVSHPKHRGSKTSSAYATDLKEIIKYPIVAWVYGHTHFSNTQVINNVLVASNQRGYDDERTSFNPQFTFQINQ